MTKAQKQAWLEERKTYLGATDCAAVLGLNPYVSPHDVWLVKRGLGTVEETVPMRRGLAMEKFIADEYKRITKITPKKSRLYRHPKYPFIACNPDREVVIGGVQGLLELKDVGYWPGKQFGKDGADQVPEHYLMQSMVQLMVTGYEFVQLAACIDGRDIQVYTYTFNENLFAHAHVFPREEAKKAFGHLIGWWCRHMENGEEPPMSGHESDHAYLQDFRSTYENGRRINTDEQTDHYCIRLEKREQRARRAILLATETKNRIKKYMADSKADTLESSVGDFTFKLNRNGVASFRTPFRSGNA